MSDLHAVGVPRPLVFNHIPKTAGTAVAEAIAAALRPDPMLHALDGVVFGNLDRLDTVHSSVRSMVLTSPEQIELDTQFVTGHISPSTTMARLPGASHVTFLREPRTRILSLWVFSRSRPEREIRRWGDYGDRIRCSKLPLVHYLADPSVALGVDNMITRFLVWPHPLVPDDGFIEPANDAVVLRDASAQLDRFDHVGLVEDSGMADKLGAFLGVALSVQRRQESGAGGRGQPADVRAEVDASGDLLQARTRLDRQLWAQVVARILPTETADDLGTRSVEQAIDRYVDASRRPRSRRSRWRLPV